MAPEDWTQWDFDLPAFAERVRRVNGLTGNVEALDARVISLRRSDPSKGMAGVVLVLAQSPEQAASLLRGLPLLLAERADPIAAVLPTIRLEASVCRELRSLGVIPVSFADEACEELDLTDVRMEIRPSLSGPGAFRHEAKRDEPAGGREGPDPTPAAEWPRDLPKRAVDLERFQKAWRIIRGLQGSKRGKTWTHQELAEHFKTNHPLLRVGDRETIAKIVRLGTDGLLDAD
jgi:hypothetical protein